VSAIRFQKGKKYIWVGSDQMTQQDAVRIDLRPTPEAREFVKLAGTIQSATRQAGRMHVIKNMERVFYVGHGPGKYSAKHKPTRIVRPPGSGLLSFADFFCSPRTLDRVLQPILADMQHDYFQALSENRKGKAEWARFRGSVCFWKALGLYTIVRNVVAIWKISRLG
jgi:hypothetical protein